MTCGPAGRTLGLEGSYESYSQLDPLPSLVGDILWMVAHSWKRHGGARGSGKQGANTLWMVACMKLTCG